MIVRANLSTLKQGHWYEYLVRFGLGGIATVVAGLVADTWGPAAGGLFLAFPAIFCASATLIEKHERVQCCFAIVRVADVRFPKFDK